MQITVAGNKKEVKDDLKLTELFELEQVETPEYVTVSINEEFVPSEQDGINGIKRWRQRRIFIFHGRRQLWR